jgi:hypothetical protein
MKCLHDDFKSELKRGKVVRNFSVSQSNERVEAGVILIVCKAIRFKAPDFEF